MTVRVRLTLPHHQQLPSPFLSLYFSRFLFCLVFVYLHFRVLEEPLTSFPCLCNSLLKEAYGLRNFKGKIKEKKSFSFYIPSLSPCNSYVISPPPFKPNNLHKRKEREPWFFHQFPSILILTTGNRSLSHSLICFHSFFMKKAK